MKRDRRKPGRVDGLRSVFVAALLAISIRSTAVEAFNIPSGSATPTLLTGDYVLVSKFSYGYSRYSVPFAPDFLHGRLFGGGMRRGDMFVFANPVNGETTIKRLVGLPGDRIQVVGGILVINGQPSQRRRIADFLEQDWNDATGRKIEVLRYRYIETLPGGVTHEILGMPVGMPEDSGPADNTAVYVVPPGHYFGMGDSRDNSMDSRFLAQLGYIPADNLIGRAELRLISLQPGAHFWQVWAWPRAMRLERFFRPIT